MCGVMGHIDEFVGKLFSMVIDDIAIGFINRCHFLQTYIIYLRDHLVL